MSAENSNGYEAFGKVVIVAVLLAVSSVINGLVLTRLWAWFVASTFGLQGLTVAQAIGLALVARFVLTPPPEPKKDGKSFGYLMVEGIVRVVVANGLTLLLGLVVVQFT